MSTVTPHLANEVVRDFLEGEMDEERSREVRQHLHSCEPCAQRVEAIRRIGDALRDLPREKADQRLTERILEQTGISTHRVYRLAGVMAGMMAAVFVGGVLLVIFTVLGVVPLHASADQLSFLDAPWKGMSGLIESSAGGLKQLLGGKVISVSAIITTALSLGVIAVLLGLDRVVGHRLLRGDGAR
jgi:predicted anti-sigma-YlaC factor YlaD